MEQIRIVVPWDVSRTSANNIVRLRNPYARARLYKRAKDVARYAWMAAGRPTLAPPVKVDIVVRRGRRLDDDNAVSGCKQLRDAIFTDGVTPTDAPRHLTLGTVTQETGAAWKYSPEVEFIISPLILAQKNDSR